MAAFIQSGLAEQGWEAEICHDGNEGLALATAGSYEALVLDLMLPGLDGLGILKELRRSSNPVPVIILTARGDVDDRVQGLDHGADDYLAKPFSMIELVARLKALARRRSGESVTMIRCGDLTVNLQTREVKRDELRIELTARELELLLLFLGSPGRVFTRTQLCEHVWGYHFDPGTNVVDVAIQRLRRKVDEEHAVKLIHTVRGTGYMMKAP
ncbi:response regulator transcription factor [Luteolibacter sp. LG18]|uniref:response regulator transcription factor n=1 Tax=Luteolibacter sp. LG18 TaxID=2819286 RepID=UPI002B29F2CB|nr:DNA-binding response regulator [Luteolibacter sp. LG18]